MLRRFILAALLAFGPAAALANPLDAARWTIVHSRGMPPRPAQVAGGWSFDFPYPAQGHVNYVTFDPGPLAGARALVVDLRIDAAPGTRFVARETPEVPATVSLYVQRRGDRLTARGRFAFYRWYAPVSSVLTLAPGVHRLTVPLDDSWTSVMGAPAFAHGEAFRDALADADRIGLVFGTRQARGHGVFATGPARLTVTGFRII